MHGFCGINRGSMGIVMLCMINKVIVCAIVLLHNILIILNLMSIPLLIIHEPFYISLPLLTVLMSPLLGGAHCVLNNIENYFRGKADMDLIEDRTEEISEFINKLFRRKR